MGIYQKFGNTGLNVNEQQFVSKLVSLRGGNTLRMCNTWRRAFLQIIVISVMKENEVYYFGKKRVFAHLIFAMLQIIKLC